MAWQISLQKVTWREEAKGKLPARFARADPARAMETNDEFKGRIRRKQQFAARLRLAMEREKQPEVEDPEARRARHRQRLAEPDPRRRSG